MRRTVREIIAGRAVVAVRSTDSVRAAARAMYDQDVGAVLVMDGERLRGIFTERDALRFFAATRRNPYVIDVGVVMTADPLTIDADLPADTAREMMLSHGFRHLPVVEGGRVIGVVSLRGVSFDLSWPG